MGWKVVTGYTKNKERRESREERWSEIEGKSDYVWRRNGEWKGGAVWPEGEGEREAGEGGR